MTRVALGATGVAGTDRRIPGPFLDLTSLEDGVTRTFQLDMRLGF